MTEEKQRTIQQNRALHLLFGQISEELNDAGLDMRKALRPSISIPWNADTVKEYLWRPVMKAQIQKESTTELTTGEIDVVFETLNRYFGERFGLHIPFPSMDSLMNKSLSE